MKGTTTSKNGALAFSVTALRLTIFLHNTQGYIVHLKHLTDQSGVYVAVDICMLLW